MGYGDFMPGFNPAMQAGTPGYAPGAWGRGASQVNNGPAVYSQSNMGQFANSANVFLQNYGMQEPTPDQVNPYLFFGNTGFMAQHPGFAQVLDNGLSGAAFTQGSRTWGEGISNVAQGILASRGAHIQNYVNQYMRPIQMAEQLQGLQQGQANIAKTQAEAGYYGDKAAATRPVIDPWSGISYTFDAKSGQWVKQGPDPGQMTHGEAFLGAAGMRSDAQKYAADKRAEATASGKTLPERIASLQEADEVEKGGKPWTPGQRATYVTNTASRLAANAAGAAKGASNVANQATGGVSQQRQDAFNTAKQEALFEKQKLGTNPYLADLAAQDQTNPDTGKPFQNAQDYYSYQDNKVKQNFPEFYPGATPPQQAAPQAKPKAVSPKGGKRPSLDSFEHKPKG